MPEDFYKNQSAKRKHYLNLILDSEDTRKLIIAGPGTGKTYTFSELLKNIEGRDNLAITFINKLAEDMDSTLGDQAEVKTFHAYCKKLLHEINGRIVLVPYLTKIINKDAEIFDFQLQDIDGAFQRLEEASHEIAFYLERGDYYEAISFNDSVYRLYRAIRDGQFELPNFTQLVFDEFQDFNQLEVALIKELEQKGPILIVGDDDQAVYSSRNASPEFLRSIYNSGEYAIFQLPYCSRCPKVVVEATQSFINSFQANGGFKSRIDRPFFPYLQDKEYENNKYPKIITAQTTNIPCLSKFILKEIRNIPEKDITASYEDDYTTVLIIGQRQYLNPIAKKLSESFSSIISRESKDQGYSIVNAYELLLEDIDSNLGWRILAECLLSYDNFSKVLLESNNTEPFKNFISQDMIEATLQIVTLLSKDDLNEEELNEIKTLLNDNADNVINYFFSPEEIEVDVDDEQKEPSILLSSFEGCKGLSAGHVFIVGLNKGQMPRAKKINNIDDYDSSKFLVAMTRTRKQLYLLTNKWYYSPKENPSGYKKSVFISMIGEDFVEDMGYLKSSDLDK